MAKVYDRNDLYFSRRGDYIVGPEGDLYDTSDDVLRSLLQEIRSRLQSDLGDWRLYPELGAELSALVGEPNNKQTAEALKAKMQASLSQFGLVDTRDMVIQYLPIDAQRLLFRMRITVAATQENLNTESLSVQILYNYSDGNLHVL